MEDFIEYVMGNPVALIILAVVVLLIVYFIIKKLLKLALICGLVLIGLCGYYYYTAPEEFPDKMTQTLQEVKEKTGDIVEKGKAVMEKGGDIAGEVVDRVTEESRKLKGD